MNIQIFGTSKSFDTKKAERWFKERGIKFQSIDLARYGMSRGEFDSVLRAVGSLDALIDTKAKGAAAIQYLAYDADKMEKLFGGAVSAVRAYRAQRPSGDRRVSARRVGAVDKRVIFFIEYYYKQSLLE